MKLSIRDDDCPAHVPFRRTVLAAAATSLLLAPATAAGLQAPDTPSALDAPARAAVVEAVGAALEEAYVFADVAARAGEHLRARLASGAYDDASDPGRMADLLTDDLRSVAADRHLRVGVIPPGADAPGEQADPTARERMRERLRRDNFGFAALGVLPGNVGYLDLRGFAPAEFAAETAVAAMGFLANADALVIDLRRNGGGDPAMVQLLSSYLFDERVHLNTLFWREGGEERQEQFWTLPHVAGRRMPEVPVYVLTSAHTFSAAEEFAYNLQTRERATIVGETTGGGANPGGFRRLPHGLGMFLPTGRAMNPVRGDNWEGRGVEPNVRASAEQALDVAHASALEALLSGVAEERRPELEWALETARARSSRSADLSCEEMQALEGTFGPRTVTLDAKGLLYRRSPLPASQLVPLGDDVFALEGVDGARIRFERAADGHVEALVVEYAGGRSDRSERTMLGSR